MAKVIVMMTVTSEGEVNVTGVASGTGTYNRQSPPGRPFSWGIRT